MATIVWIFHTVVSLWDKTPEVVVLMYHAIDNSDWKLAVTPEAFERQMKYLAKKGWIVPLEDVVSYAKKEKKLPAHAVAITFDDGYQDVLTTVLPILERYHIFATVFVPSDFSARTDPHGKARLTEEDVHTLVQSSLITIGSHGKTHRKFTELSPEEIQNESRESADAFARIVGKYPNFFAYPFGARSADAEYTIKDTGYEAAFGITEGLIHQGDNLFRLKRVQVDGTMNFLLFRLRLTGALEWNRRIVDTIRHARLLRFIIRILNGEDVVMVRQSKMAWDQQFEKGSWNYLMQGQPNTAEIARLILDNVKTKNELIRVLDVGCGNGGLARLIAGEPNIAYTGIDISETALKTARAMAPKGRFIAADAEQLPPGVGIFDVLIFNEVFFYVNPDLVLPRYHTHTAARAKIFISVVHSWRTPFIWHRIKRNIRLTKRFAIKDGTFCWDIATGFFL